MPGFNIASIGKQLFPGMAGQGQAQPLSAVTVTALPSVPTLEQFISFVKTKGLARQERFFVQISGLDRDLTLLCDEASLPGKNIAVRTLRINGMDEYRASTVDYGGNSITLSFIIDTSWTARQAMEEWMTTCVSSRMEGNEVGFYSDYVKRIGLYALVPAGIPGEALLNLSPTSSDFGIKAAASSILSNSGLSAVGNIGTGIVLDKLLSAGKRKIDNVTNAVKSKVTGLLGPVLNPILEAFRDTETIAFHIQLVDCFPTAINVMPLSYGGAGVHKMSVTFSYKYWTSSFDSLDPEGKLGTGVAKSATDALSKFGKKYTDKIPQGTSLQSLGKDLKASALRIGKRG